MQNNVGCRLYHNTLMLQNTVGKSLFLFCYLFCEIIKIQKYSFIALSRIIDANNCNKNSCHTAFSVTLFKT